MRLVSILLLVICLFTAQAQTTTVVFEWKYINVNEGYDHPSKMEFYVDEEYMGESTVRPTSEGNSYSIEISEGVHTIRTQSFSLYEGNWEEALIINDYSLDATFEIALKMQVGVKRKVSILFDIESGRVLVDSID